MGTESFGIDSICWNQSRSAWTVLLEVWGIFFKAGSPSGVLARLQSRESHSESNEVESVGRSRKRNGARLESAVLANVKVSVGVRLNIKAGWIRCLRRQKIPIPQPWRRALQLCRIESLSQWNRQFARSWSRFFPTAIRIKLCKKNVDLASWFYLYLNKGIIIIPNDVFNQFFNLFWFSTENQSKTVNRQLFTRQSTVVFDADMTSDVHERIC